MGHLLTRTAPASAGARLASVVLLAGALAALGALAMAVLAFDRLPDGPGAMLYMAVPAAMAVALLAALRLGPAARAQIAILLVSAGVGLYGAEWWLQSHPPTEPPPPAGDSRTKLDVIRDLRKDGLAAYPALFPAYLLQTRADGSLESPLVLDGSPILPLAGAAGVETVLCNESGEWIRYASDERGFANPAGIWRQASVDVALIGDSFTQGYCVPPERSFAGVIRARHPATLNLGASGNGPLVELATLAEYLPSRRPREVVWFFFEGNDVPGNLSIEKRAPVLTGYLDGRVQGLEDKAARLDGIIRAHLDDALAEGSAATDAGTLQRIRGFVTLSSLRQGLRLPSSAEKADWPLFARILENAKARVASWGGRLTVVYLPGYQPLPEIHAEVARVTAGLGIPLLDLVPVFRDHPDPPSLFALRRPNHYSEAGHALVARHVLERLETRP